MNLTLETLLPIFTAARQDAWIELGDHRARPLLSSPQTTRIRHHHAAA